jgi:hypothetical protein
VQIEIVEHAVQLGLVEVVRVPAARAREGTQTLDEFKRARTRVLAEDVADEGAEVGDARAKRRR